MGRHRKSFNTTITTAKHANLPWTKETAVLRRAPEGIPDGEWPQFVLTDAVIYEKDGESIGNPLFLDKPQIGPMVVRGRLEVNTSKEAGKTEDVTSCLLKPSNKPINIEITKSSSYAIGYDNPADGYENIIPALWVSGAAGWYEIRPARLYQTMYLEIREAITLYYEALFLHEEYREEYDQYKAKRKKKSKPSPTPSPPAPPTLGDVFFAYATAAGDGATQTEAEARYVKWAPFLAAHFSKEVDFEWSGYPFSDWVKEQAANRAKDDFPRRAPQPRHEARTAWVFKDDSGFESESASEQSRGKTATSLPVRKGRDSLFTETPVPLPERYRVVPTAATQPAVTFESPIDQLLDVLQEIASEKNLEKTKPQTIHTQLYLKCKISNYKAPQEVTAFYAKELLSRLGAEWGGTPFYLWLQDSARKPVVLEHTTAEKIPLQVLRRTKAAARPAQPGNPPASLLGKATVSHPVGDSSEDSRPVGRGRKSGKNAGLRPPGSKKRLASEMDGDGDTDSGSRRGGKPTKASHPVTDEDDDMDDATDDESVLDSEEDEGDNVAFPTTPPTGSVRVALHADRIPTMQAFGPTETWFCEEEGCRYMVRMAAERVNQEIIRLHMEGHEARSDRLKLALEESRGHMPINHLLDKIQALGQGALEKQNGRLNNQPLPPPIKRRLPI